MENHSSKADTRLRIEIAPGASSPAIGSDLVPRRGTMRPILAAPAQSHATGVLLVPRRGAQRPVLVPPAQSPPL